MRWAWQQWEFTITERLWKVACMRMFVPLSLLLITHRIDPTLPWWSVPDTHRFAEAFVAISKSWNYILTLATFVVTFFVGHSHDFWRKSYALSRSVQGRLNDIGLLCGAHANRTDDGGLTEEAAKFLDDTARNLRLLHCLFYADVCYRRTSHSGRSGTASIRLLLSFDRVARTAPGLDLLREKGLITAREYETLVSNALPPARWYLIVLEWVTARIHVATRKRIITGGAGLEQILLQKCLDLRSACMSIPDELAARMPLAYVHFTHCLVDILLLLAPFGLFANLGWFAIPMTGLFTLFYRGLLELSKSFLDPFGNRRVSFTGLSAEVNVDCLIGESNAGSLIWPHGAKQMPFDT